MTGAIQTATNCKCTACHCQKKKYLKLAGDWQDKEPAPVVEEHEGFLVIRDDLLPYGAKSRYCDKLISEIEQEEIVFGGSNSVGWGPVSMAYLCKKYNKKFTCFYAKRKEPNIYQQTVLDLGANIEWVNMGMLTVTLSRARKYTEESPETRLNIGLGLEHEINTACLVKVLDDLNLDPPEVWSVGSSGSLNRAMQIAFPNAEAFVVQTGHEMSEREIGRATRFVSPYKYDKAVKKDELPPFPSVPHYDSKCWSFMKQYAKPGALFYNVAGF